MLLCHGLLAGITPILVLLNGLNLWAAPNPTRLQPLALAQVLMESEPKTLAPALDSMATSPGVAGQARIITTGGQQVLEFYHTLSATAQTPDLVLLLDTGRHPQDEVIHPSDRTVVVGPLGTVAGQQRYPLPASVDGRQYQRVIIWCPPLNAVIGYAPLTAA